MNNVGRDHLKRQPAIEISVDDFITDFNNPENVWDGIIAATDQANSSGSVVVFSDREYAIDANRTVDMDVNWKGNGTVIRFTSGPSDNIGRGILFTSGHKQRTFEGITFDFNSLTDEGVSLRGNGSSYSFTGCEFRNVLGTQEGTHSNRRTRLWYINDDVTSIIVKDCRFKNCLSNATPDRNNRPHTVMVHGFGNPRYVRFEDCSFDRNGFVSGSRHFSGQDMDTFRLSLDELTARGRRWEWIGCTFTDSVKRFIKSNNGIGDVHIEGCLFHIEKGKVLNNRCVNLQLANNPGQTDYLYNVQIIHNEFRNEASTSCGPIDIDGSGKNDRILIAHNTFSYEVDQVEWGAWPVQFGKVIRGSTNFKLNQAIVKRNIVHAAGSEMYCFVKLGGNNSNDPATAPDMGIHNVLVEDNIVNADLEYFVSAMASSTQGVACGRHGYIEVTVRNNLTTGPAKNDVIDDRYNDGRFVQESRFNETPPLLSFSRNEEDC